MRSTASSLARASIMLFAIAPLTGCGGSVMSSFDGEKGRVRGALSQSIACTEGVWPQGKELRCISPGKAFDARLVSMDAAGTVLQLVVQFQGHGDADTVYAEFRKLMDAYGFDQTEENRCVTEGRFTEIGTTHRTACLGRIDAVQVTIDQGKAV